MGFASLAAIQTDQAVNHAGDKPRTVENALDQPEERVGTKGRRPFEDFLGKAERLKAEENGEVVDE
jgi:hypothetical protein